MKLYAFDVDGKSRLGVEWKGQVINLPVAYAAMRMVRPSKPEWPETFPADMLSFIQMGEPGLAAARETVNFMAKRPAMPVGERAIFLLDEIKPKAPIRRPGKILCSGINYRAHKEENPNAVLPSEPFFFSKMPSAVIGAGEPIVCPRVSSQVDYEVEFAAVIGKKMKNVLESDVLRHIFGYTILHDVSARDVQFKDSQITLGKNFDTFCPLGPCIVTADELTESGRQSLRAFLNGRQMQNGNTSDWLFPLPVLLSFLSHRMTLEPGDVVSTGTPAGVGVFQKPPVYLKNGDVVRLEIDGIGVLENPVIAE